MPPGSEAALARHPALTPSLPQTHTPPPGPLPAAGIGAVLGVTLSDVWQLEEPLAPLGNPPGRGNSLHWRTKAWKKHLLWSLEATDPPAPHSAPSAPWKAPPGHRPRQHRCLWGAPKPPPHLSPQSRSAWQPWPHRAAHAPGTPCTGHHRPGAAGHGWGCAGTERSPRGREGRAEQRGRGLGEAPLLGFGWKRVPRGWERVVPSPATQTGHRIPAGGGFLLSLLLGPRTGGTNESFSVAFN